MKKILFLAAVTILAAVSCNKIEEEGANTFEPSNVPSFVASVDGADTKTVIDGMKSYWNGLERIWVLNGKSGDLGWKKAYQATANKQATVTFKEEVASELTGDDYIAVYPSDAATYATWDGNIANAAKNFKIQGNQKAVPNSYDPSTHIAVAYTTAGNNNLEFKNVSSLIKFTLKSDNVTEVCFYGNSGEIITGNFDVTYNDGNPSFTTKGTGYDNFTYVKVVAEEGKTLEKDKTYYMSVLPCEFKGGFGVETVVNGEKSQKINSKTYILERSQILDLGNLEWVKPEITTRKIYFNPGGSSLWDQANAKFQAWVWGAASGDKWVKFENPENGIYSAEIPADATGMKVLRKAPSHADCNWDKWNETGNITIPNDKDLLIITGWNSGDWQWSNK